MKFTYFSSLHKATNLLYHQKVQTGTTLITATLQAITAYMPKELHHLTLGHGYLQYIDADCVSLFFLIK